jgi:hypothetical protein
VKRTDITTIAASKRAFMAPPDCGEKNMRGEISKLRGHQRACQTPPTQIRQAFARNGDEPFPTATICAVISYFGQGF